LPAPENISIHNGKIALQLAPDALVLIEIR